ncbi:MAG: trypsin-like serine protease [Flavobacteriales bacterium]
MKKNILALALFSQSMFGQTKIVGGQNSDISQFPYQVSLQSTEDSSHFCGGSIIADDWIITAAHCLVNNTAADIQIMAGVSNQSDIINAQVITVTDIFMHDFDPNTISNDIALIKLSNKLNLNNNVKIIPLVTKIDEANGALNPGVISTVSGWGNIDDLNPTFPDALQSVDIPIVDNDDALTTNPDVSAQNLVAFVLGKDACQGDSGGPLVVTVNGTKKLAGLVSYGNGCGTDYGIYARVPYFEQWISNILGGAPLAKFNIEEAYVTERNVSTSSAMLNNPTSFTWNLYMQGNTNPIDTKNSPDYDFTLNTIGNYSLRLIVENTIGKDTLVKEFTVYEKPENCSEFFSYQNENLLSIKDGSINIFSTAKAGMTGYYFENKSDLMIIDSIYFNIASLLPTPALNEDYHMDFTYSINDVEKTLNLTFKPTVGLTKIKLPATVIIKKEDAFGFGINTYIYNDNEDFSLITYRGYYNNTYADLTAIYRVLNENTTQVYGLVNGKNVLPAISFTGCNTDQLSSSVSTANSQSISIYPNPVEDVLHLTGVSSGTSVEIYNVNGQVQAQFIYTEGEIINTQDLTPGIYFLKAINAQGNTNIKFIKK